MNMSAFKPETIVNELFALYEKYGKKHATDQQISQLEQVSQAAALAEEEGFEDEVILAAFFHNIGSVCTNDAEGNGQEKLGADYLRNYGFSERLATLVESDVMAKRYIAYKYPEYYDQLSDEDRATLEIQGGCMCREEAINFEQDPDAELFVRLYYLNDKAKKLKRPMLNLPHIKLLAMSHLYKIIDQYLPAFLMPKAAMRP
jgi:2-amino-1-hydroxyethylphosphonate dioxygenase (glycine-forming)